MTASTERRWAVVLSADAIGLGAVRSLARGRIPTIVVTLNRWEPVRFSRYADKRLVPPSRDLEGAILRTLRGIDRPRRPVLIPTTDFFADFVARHRDLLAEQFRLAIPSDDVMERALDKASDTGRLAQAGVPVPDTVFFLPRRPGDLLRLLGLPLLIKPRTYVDKRELGWRNVVVSTPEHLTEFYATQRAAMNRVIAQELIPGPDTDLWECIAVFGQDSELVSAFTFRKLRTMPAHYGQTAYGRSERNERIIEVARIIGRELKYTGPADVDLKYDARTDSYKFLELNPRLGMCHHFGTRCGVNLALDAWRVAADEPLGERPVQKDGVRFLSVLEDLGGQVHDGRSPLRALGGALAALLHRPVGAYFDWRDPLPGPCGTGRLVLRLLDKVRHGQLASVFTKDYGRRPAPPRPRHSPAFGVPLHDRRAVTPLP